MSLLETCVEVASRDTTQYNGVDAVAVCVVVDTGVPAVTVMFALSMSL